MGCDLKRIHQALADQVRARINADVEVYAWPQRTPANKSVTVYPGASGPYVDYFGTMGANGMAAMSVELVVEFVSIDDESEFSLLSELLSVGTGAEASIVDAVHADVSLGGLVQSATILTVDWPFDPAGPITARLPCNILFLKEGAEV